MKRLRGSITLIAATLLGAVITVVVICATILLFSLFGDDGSYAQYDAANAIRAAVARNERRELVINESSPQAEKATPTLSEFKRDFPGFWYVVSDGRETIQYGPVPERVLAGLARWPDKAPVSGYTVHGTSMRRIRSATTAQTEAGEFLIEVGGTAYSGWQIAIGTVKDTSFLTIPILIVLIATILAAIVIVPMLIVRPVRRVATAAEMIDGTREGVRLPTKDAPLELVPIVSAFNRALERIDATAAEQRRFLSNAAHELRTPLARARTRLEGIGDPALRAALVSDLQSLSLTVTMLLQLARLSASPAEPQELDLVAVTKRIAAEHGPAALDSGIEIAFSGPPEAIKTRGSAQAISIALSNIIRNAVQCSRQGQQILIEVDASATVRVIDHGRGIKTGDKTAVFQPFVRRGGDGEGTGLGLAIVAQVMALHQGIAAIEDTPAGGTTVVLRFSRLSSSPTHHATAGANDGRVNGSAG